MHIWRWMLARTTFRWNMELDCMPNQLGATISVQRLHLCDQVLPHCCRAASTLLSHVEQTIGTRGLHPLGTQPGPWMLCALGGSLEK